MAAEAEKRLHRCCFTGHRPEKLTQSEFEVKVWLREQIEQAVAEGYTTFITVMAMGVDIWAGQIVVELKKANPNLHLIAAVPWPGFSSRWHDDWKQQYQQLLADADLVREVKKSYSPSVFQDRNEWMVNHSHRVIAYYNGQAGGTRNTIDYAHSIEYPVELIVGGIN